MGSKVGLWWGVSVEARSFTRVQIWNVGVKGKHRYGKGGFREGGLWKKPQKNEIRGEWDDSVEKVPSNSGSAQV